MEAKISVGGVGHSAGIFNEIDVVGGAVTAPFRGFLQPSIIHAEVIIVTGII